MMQNPQNQNPPYLTDNLLKELKRCEKIFKTRPCLEILPTTQNRKSRVDDVNFKKISTDVVTQMELMDRIEWKLYEMKISLKVAKDLNGEMNLKYDIPE